MKSPSTPALLGVAAALMVSLGVVSIALPSLAGILSAVVVMAAGGLVAFAAQSRRLRDDKRLVYRPVYVRRHDVQRRVTSDED